MGYKQNEKYVKTWILKNNKSFKQFINSLIYCKTAVNKKIPYQS